jgi:hypothetical protein
VVVDFFAVAWEISLKDDDAENLDIGLPEIES